MEVISCQGGKGFAPLSGKEEMERSGPEDQPVFKSTAQASCRQEGAE